MDLIQTIENIATSPDIVTLAVHLLGGVASLVSAAISARQAGDESKAAELATEAIKLASAAVDAAAKQMTADNAAIDAEEAAKFDTSDTKPMPLPEGLVKS